PLLSPALSLGPLPTQQLEHCVLLAYPSLHPHVVLIREPRSNQHSCDLSPALREHDVARGARARPAPPAPPGVTVRRRLELATDRPGHCLPAGGQLLPVLPLAEAGLPLLRLAPGGRR